MRKNTNAVAPKNTARRHNRSHNHATVNQNVAAHPPKWMDRGDGVLVRKSNRFPGEKNTMIKLTNGSWKSLSPNRFPFNPVSDNVIANAAE